MIFRTPCPKCRHSITAGTIRCANCSYRLSPGEANRAMLMRIGIVLFTAFAVGIALAAAFGR